MKYYEVLDKIIDKNTKDKYDNILKYNNNLSEMSKTNIKNICCNKTKEEKIVKEKEKKNEYFNLIYQNHWHKLKPIHQKTKLEEYINNLPTNQKNKKTILENVFSAIDNKILTKKSNVEYDHTNLSITKIKGLNYNEKDKIYTFSL